MSIVNCTVSGILQFKMRMQRMQKFIESVGIILFINFFLTAFTTVYLLSRLLFYRNLVIFWDHPLNSQEEIIYISCCDFYYFLCCFVSDQSTPMHGWYRVTTLIKTASFKSEL